VQQFHTISQKVDKEKDAGENENAGAGAGGEEAKANEASEEKKVITSIIEALLNMNVSLSDQLSLNQIRDILRVMAKSEGGIGLDEGMIDFDHVAELLHFLLN